MNILFTTRSGLLPSLIRANTHENVSHCAIEAYGFVVHSNYRGVSIEPLSKFKEINKIVDIVDIGKSHTKLMATLAQSHRKGYDILALLYLACKHLLGKVGISLPKKNLWQSTGMYLCTEFVTQVLTGQEDSMITPGQLRDKLRSQK